MPDHHAVFQLHPPAGPAARARVPGGDVGLRGRLLGLGVEGQGSPLF